MQEQGDVASREVKRDEEVHEVSIDMIYESPSERDQSRDASTETVESETETEPSFLEKSVSVVKDIFSASLLIFCTILVTAAIFGKQTKATGKYSLQPVIAFILFWVILLFLALIEGGLNCMVGLVPVDKALYAQTHPRAYCCTKMAHKDSNIERFIIGRQFLDLMSVFSTNLMASTIKGATVLGLPVVVCGVFLDSGLAVIFVTIVLGQLCRKSMPPSAIEASGICHVVYLLQLFVERWAGKKSERQDNTAIQKTTFWLRVVLSICLLCIAFAVTFKALFAGDTTMWTIFPPYASVIIFVCIVFFVGFLDALQIAFMAAVYMPEHVMKEHPVAQRNCDLVFKRQNLPSFLLGRQIFQTFIQFGIARITTISRNHGENVFGVNDTLQQILSTGLLGALMTTIIASLCWRVLANSFPMAFLSSPLTRPIVHLCLFTESTGVCHIVWKLAKVHRRLAGFKTDDYHLALAAKNRPMPDLAMTERGSDSEGNQSQHENSV